MLLGRVAEIWRYPVSGLQGEKLGECRVGQSGIAGDHLYVLKSREGGKILDPLSHSSSLKGPEGRRNMLEFRAALSEDGNGKDELVIEEAGKALYTSRNPDGIEALSDALGGLVEIIRYPRIVESRVRAGRTLHLLTDSSLHQMRWVYPVGDFDARRFRPNILITSENGSSGFVEEGWIGRDLVLGDRVRLHVEKANLRCKVTGMKQAGIDEDVGILQTIQRGNSGNLGVMCSVLEGGELRAGDPVLAA
jgi:uncharacterized protein